MRNIVNKRDTSNYVRCVAVQKQKKAARLRATTNGSEGALRPAMISRFCENRTKAIYLYGASISPSTTRQLPPHYSAKNELGRGAAHAVKATEKASRGCAESALVTPTDLRRGILRRNPALAPVPRGLQCS